MLIKLNWTGRFFQNFNRFFSRFNFFGYFFFWFSRFSVFLLTPIINRKWHLFTLVSKDLVVQ